MQTFQKNYYAKQFTGTNIDEMNEFLKQFPNHNGRCQFVVNAPWYSNADNPSITVHEPTALLMDFWLNGNRIVEQHYVLVEPNDGSGYNIRPVNAEYFAKNYVAVEPDCCVFKAAQPA